MPPGQAGPRHRRQLARRGPRPDEPAGPHLRRADSGAIAVSAGLPGIFLRSMKLFSGLRRRLPVAEATEVGRSIPDPGKVPTARGTWEEAALTNVDITEVVKRQIRSVTPPWKK